MVFKALYNAIHRETIQQATDKRVAIEGLVIKDLLRTLQCQWRWVSSERQLGDGLTKLSARNERYKGHYVQLVADMDYTAAKKKAQEERKRILQETRSSSDVATTLVAVVGSGVTAAEGLKIEKSSDETSYFQWCLVVTAIIGVLAILWYIMITVNWCERNSVSSGVRQLKDENEKLVDNNTELKKEIERVRNEMEETKAEVLEIVDVCDQIATADQAT